MAFRIEIGSKINDTRVLARKKSLSDLSFSNKISDLTIIDVHTIDKKIEKDNLPLIYSALSSPVSQTVGQNLHPPKIFLGC